jgi:hypothetical protein
MTGRRRNFLNILSLSPLRSSSVKGFVRLMTLMKITVISPAQTESSNIAAKGVLRTKRVIVTSMLTEASIMAARITLVRTTAKAQQITIKDNDKI